MVNQTFANYKVPEMPKIVNSAFMNKHKLIIDDLKENHNWPLTEASAFRSIKELVEALENKYIVGGSNE